MADAIRQRKFTAEMTRPAATGPTASPESDPDAELAEIRHRELMAALAAIAERVEATTAADPSPEPASSGEGMAEAEAAPAPSPAGADLADQQGLRQELARLSQAIEQTKREIAALRLQKDPPDPLVAASNELDAVVQATELATDTILGAAERIEELISQLRNQSSGDAETATLDEVSEQVVTMFEACNFQDITGQRITKVINAMKFVEERVEQMIAIMGGTEAFAGIEVADEATPGDDDEDKKLMQGPASDPETAISQDDIDKMFS